MEREYGHGGTSSLRRAAAGGGADDGAVPGVRHLAEDRPQDLRAVEGARAGGDRRPAAQARTGREPAADAGRGDDRRAPPRAPDLGARKLRELLMRRLGPGVAVPARSTIHAVLDRHGLVEHARARRPRATGTPLSAPDAPNDLWCGDFKGEFRLGNGRLCYPLTVTDQVSRYLLMVEALESTARSSCFHGLPPAVRGARPAARHPLGQRRPLRSAPASTVSPGSRSGGCGSASASSASHPASRSRTAATSACTLR